MSHRSDYLNIHEKGYQRLRAEGKGSWSLPEDINERVRFYLRAMTDLDSGSSLLVLGCGDGEVCLALAAQGFKVTGVDISPTAIGWAKEKAMERKVEARFIELDITAKQSESASFDFVIDDHCLHCIVGSERAAALDFIRRNLKVGGHLIMRTQCGDPPKGRIDETWDPITRCQVHNGVAGRYFGRPESLLAEFDGFGFTPLHHRVFQYPGGWQMFEGIFKPEEEKMAKTVFEKIISGELEGSFVHQDSLCAAFMDLNPLNPGHILVVPKSPVEKLSLLDSKIAAHLFEIAQKVLRGLERSGLKVEGANIFLSDGEIAGQEVPHVHLHVVPRYKGDGLKLSFGKPFRKADRLELDRLAARIRAAIQDFSQPRRAEE